jgi:hypothetical protein
MNRDRDVRDEEEAFFHTPDWTYWLDKPLVRLDDAIILSCNIDPGWHGDRKTIEKVSRRKGLAEAHHANGTLQLRDPLHADPFKSYLGSHLISLAEFRRWGESLRTPLTFPTPYPEASPQKPEWPFWQNHGLVTLDDAIVLSCDIEPRWHEDRSDIAIVIQRKTIADSHVASNSLRLVAPSAPTAYLGHHRISLGNFRIWGESLRTPFTFPADPEATPSDGAQMAGQVDKDGPLGTRERNSLLRIIGGLAHHAQIDISEGGPGAKQIEKAVELAGFDGPKDKAIGFVLEKLRKLVAL